MGTTSTILMLVGVTAFAYPLGSTRAQEPPKGAVGKNVEARTRRTQAVVRRASDVRWKDVPEMEGVKRGVIWGNPERTAYGALEKLLGGTSLPLHWHTYDARVVILSGALVVAVEGKRPQELGAGSYYFLPGGLKHTKLCKAPEDCLCFVMQPGLDDTKWGGEK